MHPYEYDDDEIHVYVASIVVRVWLDVLERYPGVENTLMIVGLLRSYVPTPVPGRDSDGETIKIPVEDLASDTPLRNEATE